MTSTVDLPAELNKAWQDYRTAQLKGHQATADGHMRRIDALLDMIPRTQ